MSLFSLSRWVIAFLLLHSFFEPNTRRFIACTAWSSMYTEALGSLVLRSFFITEVKDEYDQSRWKTARSRIKSEITLTFRSCASHAVISTPLHPATPSCASCRCSSKPGSDSEFLCVEEGALGKAGALLPLPAAGSLRCISHGLPGLLWYVSHMMKLFWRVSLWLWFITPVI